MLYCEDLIDFGDCFGYYNRVLGEGKKVYWGRSKLSWLNDVRIKRNVKDYFIYFFIYSEEWGDKMWLKSRVGESE